MLNMCFILVYLGGVVAVWMLFFARDVSSMVFAFISYAKCMLCAFALFFICVLVCSSVRVCVCV